MKRYRDNQRNKLNMIHFTRVLKEGSIMRTVILTLKTITNQFGMKGVGKIMAR